MAKNMTSTKSRRVRYSEGEVRRNLFYKFPKYLMLDPEYRGLSANAKLAYMVLLDRHQLSLKNKMVDATGDVYVIFSRLEMQGLLEVSKNLVTRVMNELKAVRLLEEIRLGLGKPNRIYLLTPKNPKFDEPETPTNMPPDEDFSITTEEVSDSLNKGIKPPSNVLSNGHKVGIPSYSNKTYVSNTKERESGGEAPIPPSPSHAHVCECGRMVESTDETMPDKPVADEPQVMRDEYGKYRNVKLFKHEYDKLVSQYGEDVVKDYIGQLDGYIYVETGRPRYKDTTHMEVIIRWITRANPKGVAGQSKNRFINFNQRNNDYAMLEKLERAYRDQKYGVAQME